MPNIFTVKIQWVNVSPAKLFPSLAKNVAKRFKK
jgi:hypothetical protein